MNSLNVKPSPLYYLCCHKDCARAFATVRTSEIGTPIPSVVSQAQRPICKVTRRSINLFSAESFRSARSTQPDSYSKIAFVCFWPNPVLLPLQIYFAPKSGAPTQRIWNKVSLRQPKSLVFCSFAQSAPPHMPYSIRSSQYSYYVRPVNRSPQQSR